MSFSILCIFKTNIILSDTWKQVHNQQMLKFRPIIIWFQLSNKTHLIIWIHFSMLIFNSFFASELTKTASQNVLF